MTALSSWSLVILSIIDINKREAMSTRAKVATKAKDRLLQILGKFMLHFWSRNFCQRSMQRARRMQKMENLQIRKKKTCILLVKNNSGSVGNDLLTCRDIARTFARKSAEVCTRMCMCTHTHTDRSRRQRRRPLRESWEPT